MEHQELHTNLALTQFNKGPFKLCASSDFYEKDTNPYAKMHGGSTMLKSSVQDFDAGRQGNTRKKRIQYQDHQCNSALIQLKTGEQANKPSPVSKLRIPKMAEMELINNYRSL